MQIADIENLNNVLCHKSSERSIVKIFYLHKIHVKLLSFLKILIIKEKI